MAATARGVIDLTDEPQQSPRTLIAPKDEFPDWRNSSSYSCIKPRSIRPIPKVPTMRHTDQVADEIVDLTESNVAEKSSDNPQRTQHCRNISENHGTSGTAYGLPPLPGQKPKLPGSPIHAPDPAANHIITMSDDEEFFVPPGPAARNSVSKLTVPSARTQVTATGRASPVPVSPGMFSQYRDLSPDVDLFALGQRTYEKSRQHAQDAHHSKHEDKRKRLREETRMYASMERHRLARSTREAANNAAEKDTCLPNESSHRVSTPTITDVCSRERQYAAAPSTMKATAAPAAQAITARPEVTTSSDLTAPARKWDKYHCPICEAAYTSRPGLKYHFGNCVRKYGNLEGKAWDDHESCGKEYIYERDLQRHAEVCGRKEDAESKISQRLANLIAQGPKSLQCAICLKGFSRPNYLKQHFEHCERLNGNPQGKSWDSHESCRPNTSAKPPLNCSVCKTPKSLKGTADHIAGCARRSLHTRAKTSAAEKPNMVMDDTSIARKAPVDALPNITLNIDRKRNKSRSNQPIVAPLTLKPNCKRALGDIPLDTLYNPKQVASKKELERYTERKRQKLHNRSNQAVPEDDTSSRESNLRDSGNQSNAFQARNTNKQEQLKNLDRTFDTIDLANKHSDFTNSFSGGNATFDIAVENDAADALKSDIIAQPVAPKSYEDISVQEADRTNEPEPLMEKDIQTAIPLARPTISGKTISEATLAIWEAHKRETIKEDVERPELIYIYFVELTNWGAGLPEENAMLKNIGPFNTLAEANSVAAQEVTSPMERFQIMLECDAEENENLHKSKPGWSYKYVEDQTGMQTHKLVAAGIHAQAVVRREIPPPPNRSMLPISAFRTPPMIYLVHTLTRFPPPNAADDLFGDEVDANTSKVPDCRLITHGAFTVPDLAYQRAGKIYLAMVTQGKPASQRDGIKMHLRREMEDLEAEGFVDAFQKTVVAEQTGDGDEEGGTGTCAVWVEKVAVEGPRN